jgi:hypothetical protein
MTFLHLQLHCDICGASTGSADLPLSHWSEGTTEADYKTKIGHRRSKV